MGIKSKILGVAALSALAMSAIAGGPEPAPVCGPFDGLYVGVNAGWAWFKNRDNYYQLALITPAAPDAVAYQANPSFTANEFAVGGAIGWGKVYDSNYYFGLEVHGTYHDLSKASSFFNIAPISQNLFTSTVSARNEWDWGVDFMPGYVYNTNTLFFAKIGYRGGDVKYGATTSITFNPAGPTFTATSPSADEYLNGMNLGAGVKYAFYDHWSASLEFDYTWYTQKRTSVPSFTAAQVGVPGEIRRFSKLDYVQVLAGVSYNFCDLI